MRLDLTDAETLALLNLLTETIEADRFPMSPRIHIFRTILGEVRPDGTGAIATGETANAERARPE
jgi:hypothetical protein